MPLPGARLVEPSRERVQRELVERDVQHAVVGVERVLRAVAVVRVPVDDHHPLAPRRQGGRRHRDVVEQAEAHRPVRRGVMTGRAQREERGVGLAPLETLGRVEPRSGGEEGGVPRLGPGRGVGVEVAAPNRQTAPERRGTPRDGASPARPAWQVGAQPGPGRRRGRLPRPRGARLRGGPAAPGARDQRRGRDTARTWRRTTTASEAYEDAQAERMAVLLVA